MGHPSVDLEELDDLFIDLVHDAHCSDRFEFFRPAPTGTNDAQTRAGDHYDADGPPLLAHRDQKRRCNE
jgi:hypothetical protein